MFREPIIRAAVSGARLVSQRRSAAAALPYPIDESKVHVAGPNPDRLMFFGAGSIAGIGVSSNRSSIVGQSARQISTLTGRGVDAEVYSDQAMTVRTALTAFDNVRTSRFDAIVVSLGINDVVIRTSPAAWRSGITALLDAIEESIGAACCVFLLGIGDPGQSPLFRDSFARAASARAREFNRITREIAEQRESATYLDFIAGPAERGLQAYSAESHARWAAQISPPIAAALDRDLAAGTRRGGYRAEAEPERQAAVEELDILDTEAEDRFDRIVRMAAVLLKTPSAVFAVIDRDRVWLKSRVGVEVTEVERSASLCTTTITQRGGLVVDDASKDPRFERSPLVSGSMHLRYYQGYPIESADGFPVGALCVFDSEPHQPEDTSMNVLRDLALLIEGELTR